LALLLVAADEKSNTQQQKSSRGALLADSQTFKKHTSI